MKNKKGTIGMNRQMLFLILILGIFIYFGFMQTGSVVIKMQSENYKIHPIETGEFNFAGYSGTYETPYLGCIGTKDEGSWIVINEKNDEGSRNLCNSIQDGDILFIKSQMATGLNDAQRIENYVNGKIRLPKGVLNIDYVLSRSYSGKAVDAQCGGTITVDGITKNCCKVGTSSATSGGFEILIDEEREIQFSVKSITPDMKQANSVSEITLTFEPEEFEEETEEEEYLPPSEAEDEIEPSTQELTFIEKINQSINQFFEGIISWFKNLF